MLLRRILIPLGSQHFQSLDQLLAGIAGLDDRVHEAAFGGDVGVGEAVGGILSKTETRGSSGLFIEKYSIYCIHCMLCHSMLRSL
jgi:hypothetical protein